MYKFAINAQGANKKWDFEVLTTCFENLEGTIAELVSYLKNGWAFAGGWFKEGERRSKSAMMGSQWLTIEIDNAALLRDADGKVIKSEDGKEIKVYDHQMTVTEALEHPFVRQYCAIAYTTASHTPEWNRFRLIFRLPKFVEPKTCEALTAQLMAVLPHDPACKDCSRVFYGNTEADFFIVNEESSISLEWMAQAIASWQAEQAERERRRKDREEWLRQNQDLVENSKAIAIEALKCIPPRQTGSGNYSECMRVLMALKEIFGEDEAEILGEAWSPSEAGTTWNVGRKLRSFKRSGGVGTGTLFRIAQQHGFKFPKSESKPVDRSAPKVKSDRAAGIVSENIEGGEKPKTLPEAIESPESQSNGYAELRLAIADVMAHSDPLERDYLLGKLSSKKSVPRSLVDRIVIETARRHSTRKTSFMLGEIANLAIEGAKWLIPRFLPAAGLTMLGGFAKDGKSTLMYDMIRSLVTQAEFLGETPSKECRVLLVQAEEPEMTIKGNLKGIGLFDNSDLLLRDPLRIEMEWSIDDLDRLEQWVLEFRPDIVFFDSLRALAKRLGKDENSAGFADFVYALQERLKTLGIPGLIIHHNNKSKEAIGLEKLAGSSAIPGACDDILQWVRCSENPEDTRRHLVMKGRNCRGRFLVEYVEDEYPYFHFENKGEVGVSADEKTLADRVLLAIATNQQQKPKGLSSSDIREVLELSHDSGSFRSLYRALRRLVETGILSVAVSDRDRRVQVYSIPSLVPSEVEEVPAPVVQSPLESNGSDRLVTIPGNSYHNSFVGESKPPVTDVGGHVAWRRDAEPKFKTRPLPLAADPRLIVDKNAPLTQEEKQGFEIGDRVVIHDDWADSDRERKEMRRMKEAPFDYAGTIAGFFRNGRGTPRVTVTLDREWEGKVNDELPLMYIKKLGAIV
jgi:AAA domain/Primase C terminal 2 (PriCT-2)